MSDFYPRTQRMPLDQADGLRRLFGGRKHHVLPLAANPHVASSALVLDRLAGLLAALGKQVLVVDAAGTSPLPHELADVDLSACIETLAPRVSYLAARGLPRNYVDTRGSAAGLLSAVQDAAPQAEVLLLDGATVDDIKGVYFQRLATYKEHKAQYPDLQCYLNGGFFDGRSDYAHWK